MSTLKVNTVLSATTPTVLISDGLSVSGVSTLTGGLKVGTAITMSSNGNFGITGIMTASNFVGGGIGKILQVVQNSYSTQATLNSTSYVDTGLTATITPSATSSKVLILGFLSFTTSHFASPYNVYGFGCNIVRGSTEIKAGDTGQYYQAVADSDISYTVFNQPHQPIFLDSPNTTSSTTYKIQAKESDVNANLTINASSQTSEMILIEVGV